MNNLNSKLTAYFCCTVILSVNAQRDNYQYFAFSENHVPEKAALALENVNRSISKVENDTVDYNLVDDVTQMVDLRTPENTTVDLSMKQNATSTVSETTFLKIGNQFKLCTENRKFVSFYVPDFFVKMLHNKVRIFGMLENSENSLQNCFNFIENVEVIFKNFSENTIR